MKGLVIQVGRESCRSELGERASSEGTTMHGQGMMSQMKEGERGDTWTLVRAELLSKIYS